MCAPIPPPTARSIRPECSKPCAPVNYEPIPKAPESIVPVALGSSHKPVSFRSSKVFDKKWAVIHQWCAPIAFTLAGFLVVELGEGSLALDPSVVHHLAEAVLVILLFNDASTVRLADLRAESGLIGRLLLIGLPVTIGAGYALAATVMPDLGSGPLLLLAVALAPTDAGLGEATVCNPAVPLRVRSVLNVESGLNDGLATPVVVAALAIAAEPTLPSSRSQTASVLWSGISSERQSDR